MLPVNGHMEFLDCNNSNNADGGIQRINGVLIVSCTYTRISHQATG